MKTADLNGPSFWQLVFTQSKVNGGRYCEEELPESKWNWPQDTYLQQRMRELSGNGRIRQSSRTTTDPNTNDFAA